MQSNISGVSIRPVREKFFQIAIIAIIAFGIVLRAAKYLPAFSMRGDELAITLNLIHRSPFDLLTKPLDFEQAAPFGFVLAVKTLITLFGQSEYVLRLIAFGSGCASLILMHNLLTKTGGQYGDIFALAAFAFGNYLIYYSAELKQYSSDVLICLTLLFVFYRHVTKETKADDFVLLAVLGVLALCFSYPALFVLAGVGITLFLYHWNDKRNLLRTTLMGSIWAGTFLAIYFLLLRHQTGDTYLITFWDNLLSFMPMPPWRDLAWFPKAANGLFFVVAGLSSHLILVMPLYILGLWGFWQEKKLPWILVLTIPVVLNVIVSGFQKYPFHGRLILYLLPLVLIVLGKGIDLWIGLIRNQALANIVFGVLLILLLTQAVPTTNSYLFTRSYLQDDLKPVLSYVRDNKQDGDLSYLYHYIIEPYEYYAATYGLENLPSVPGQDNSSEAKKYWEELSSLPRGERIWFVFSFVHEGKMRKGVKQDERELILKYLRENGTLVDEFYSTSHVSSAHLFILK
jgi:hypothetical protein